MSLLRFIHAADLHLDSPFKGLKTVAPHNVANALYNATFDAFDNIIDLCISERVDALLIAGDVYDGADRSLRAQQKFIAGLERLDKAGIRSFVCHGNHDPLDGWEARLEYPPGCRRFGKDFEAEPVFEEDPARAVVHGISYQQREVTDNLVLKLGKVDHTPFSIGLLHANVGGDPNHPQYSPCTLDDLRYAGNRGIDYWALGHVHTRRVLNQHEPTVAYPGNPQGRHANEPGERGVYLVTVDHSRRVELDFRAVDTVRWARLNVDVSTAKTEQDLQNLLDQRVEKAWEEADERGVVARIALTGRAADGVRHSLRRTGYLEDLQEGVNDNWASDKPFVWCERIEDETAPPFDRNERLKGSDFVADVLRVRDESRTDEELLGRLRSDLQDLYAHWQFKKHLGGAEPAGDELADLLDEAESMAVDLLLGDDR